MEAFLKFFPSGRPFKFFFQEDGLWDFFPGEWLANFFLSIFPAPQIINGRPLIMVQQPISGPLLLTQQIHLHMQSQFWSIIAFSNALLVAVWVCVTCFIHLLLMHQLVRITPSDLQASASVWRRFLQLSLHWLHYKCFPLWDQPTSCS